MDLLDIPKPEHVAFQSLLPQIEQGSGARGSIYLAMFDSQRGIISGDNKLIIYPKSGDRELYDLSQDPWETHNLIDKRKSKRIEATLVEQLQQWQTQVGDEVLVK
ncbi:DUF4976 domain-containing protein [Reichenbachiella agarivorans]|uniref:DUF4976 domain-containing protein n=1 Tax=Reichenbachiella agarivorans TaxID=2979464 RepID=A0ABY6CUH7_9BACT|nr:DUF4976 domain-containing protein [Reichenbachiella agarivorans]